MSNMSYCRFQNTLADLYDCYENFDDSDLSGDEEKARERLLELCRNIIREYDREYDLEEIE